MKRAGRLFDAILDRENLQWGFWKASRGKPASRAVRAFAADLDGNWTAWPADCSTARSKWAVSTNR